MEDDRAGLTLLQRRGDLSHVSKIGFGLTIINIGSKNITNSSILTLTSLHLGILLGGENSGGKFQKKGVPGGTIFSGWDFPEGIF